MASRGEGSQPRDERRTPGKGVLRDSWFGQLTMLLNVIGTVLIIAMSIAVNADILGRDLFNQPVPGVTEFLGLAIVSVVFLQMANTLRENRHISNDIILSAIGQTHPQVAHFFYGLFHVIGAGLMALITWYVWPIMIDNYVGGYYKGTAGVIEIPVWPFMLTVIVGGTASTVQYLLLALQEFRNARNAIAARPEQGTTL